MPERCSFRISEVPAWLQHWYSLKPTGWRSGTLEQELQKIYDSEINVTLRTGDKGQGVRIAQECPDLRARRSATPENCFQVLDSLRRLSRENKRATIVRSLRVLRRNSFAVTSGFRVPSHRWEHVRQRHLHAI